MNVLNLNAEITNGQKNLNNTVRANIINELENRELITDVREFKINSYAFGYFNIAKEFDIDQILASSFHTKKMSVTTDENAIIFLPLIGYFFFSLKNEKLWIEIDNTDYSCSRIRSQITGEMVDFRFEESLFIPDTQIELTTRSNFYSKHQLELARNANGRNIGDPTVITNHTKYFPLICQAIEAIASIDEEQHKEILMLCSNIVLFEADEIIAFTSIDVHGMIFIKPTSTCNTVFFIDHIIHECSHIALNCVLADLERYFKVDPFLTIYNSPFRKGEKRGVYHTIHACFVLARLSSFYGKYLPEVEGTEFYNDVVGRLLLNIARLEEGISYINDENIYTDQGKKILNYLNTILVESKNAFAELILNYDVSDQPIEFDINLFLKTNNL